MCLIFEIDTAATLPLGPTRAAQAQTSEPPRLVTNTLRKLPLAILVTASIAFAPPAFANQRQDCLMRIKENTMIAGPVGVAGVGGAIAGTVTGAAACSGFLLAAIVDLGISFGTCVTLAAAAGTAVGTIAATSAAEDAVIEEKKKCARLPED